MKKSILSVSGAFMSLLCAVIGLVAFVRSEEGIFAVLALLSAFASLAFAIYGIEGTQAFDFLSNFFAEEGGEE